MLRVEIDGVFECDVNTFWEHLYFLEDYGRAVYLEGLGFTSWKLESLKDDGQTLTRRVVMEKPIPAEVPKALRKLTGDSSALIEEGVFDRHTRVYNFTLTPERLQKHGHVRGTVRVEPHPRGCLRKVALEAEVKLLGMGKLVERNLLDTLQSSYREGVVHANALLRQRRGAQPAAGPNP